MSDTLFKAGRAYYDLEQYETVRACDSAYNAVCHSCVCECV